MGWKSKPFSTRVDEHYEVSIFHTSMCVHSSVHVCILASGARSQLHNLRRESAFPHLYRKVLLLDQKSVISGWLISLFDL